MALTGVLRPGHVSIRVLELEPAVKHYRDVLGLIEVARDAQNRVYLKGWDEQDHSSIILREADEACRPIPGQLRQPIQPRLQRLAEVARHHHPAELRAPVRAGLQADAAEVAAAADVDAPDRSGGRAQQRQHAERLQRVEGGLGEAEVALVEHRRQGAGGCGFDEADVQALRIEVNRELAALEGVLPAAVAALAVGGRFAVLSYHSLEDRLVKRTFAAGAADRAPRDLPVVPENLRAELRLLTRGAERPGAEETATNPRAASARLRVAERIREAS